MKPSEPGSLKALFWVALGLAVLSAAAVWYFDSGGFLLYYGDAEAHLNAARRILDSKTPGYDQLGSPWLPLPHALILPFARYDGLWRSGLAGSIPMAACFVIAGCFLFAAARRVFQSTAAALAAAAMLALNPNLLYLQSTAMTESVFAASLCALLYFTVRFRETQGWGAAAGAGFAALAGTLTRYDGWFLLPFAAAYIFAVGGKRRVGAAVLFCAIAGAGPLYWLGHNWWIKGDPLEFYRGPYSAMAIQAGRPYPGKGDWGLAALYYGTAVRLCAGWILTGLALAGGLVMLAKRKLWPVVLLALAPLFYVWSLHSSGTPIFVPELWPHSYYNTRYGLAALPLLAFCAAALAAAAPRRVQRGAAMIVILAAVSWWAWKPGAERWVTWAESRANSAGRRAWMTEAARYLGPRYVRGSGIVASGGDDALGIYREMGVPLRETLNICNDVLWDATLARPDLHLWQAWAVVKRGDVAQKAIERAAGHGVRYRLEMTIANKNEPVVEIYHRIGGPHRPPGV